MNKLLSNRKIKSQFFIDVGDIAVFDKLKFQHFVSNKNFLPDSFTQYKNKIGLSTEGSYLSENRDVVLTYPYKDCILEGGQDKNSSKRTEIFWNEVLAPEECDRLLAPKALSGFKKISKDGEGYPDNISLQDNFLIRGNNLLVLRTLLPTYRGKIKLIYIDPPYNTGNDSFKYNDRFNHSAWLTFMKNRLEVAKVLLREDGVIFVQCDDNEQAYLKVLMDEIFGREQFVETITVVNNPRGRDYGGIANMHEFMHIYCKNVDTMKMFKLVDPEKSFPFSDSLGPYETRELRNRNTAFNDKNRPNLCYPFYVNPNSEIDNGFLEISLSPKDGFVEVMPAKSQGVQTVWRWGKEKSLENLNIHIVGKAMKEDGRFMIVEKYRDNSSLARSVWWDKDVNSERGTVHLRELFGEKVFSFPKPETLISRVIEISTKTGDIVLDYHLGSGTTAAVAHKMGRRWVGIEQMDYIEDITKVRLEKVIEGEQGGISKSVNWQGGGDFIYCELATYNQKYVEAIQSAKNSDDLSKVWEEMKRSSLLSYKIDPSQIDNSKDSFEELSLEDQKRFLIETLDANMLYVPRSEIDDDTYGISDRDKALNKQLCG